MSDSHFMNQVTSVPDVTNPRETTRVAVCASAYRDANTDSRQIFFGTKEEGEDGITDAFAVSLDDVETFIAAIRVAANEAKVYTHPVLLSRSQVAERIGVQPSTLDRYKLPEPDAIVGTTRGWATETIDAWNAARPGRGARTDLDPKRPLSVPSTRGTETQ